MAASMNQNRKLPDIFDDIWKTYEYLDTTEEGTTSNAVQASIVQEDIVAIPFLYV